MASSRHSIGSSPGSTCRAYFTKWPEVYAVLDQRAASTAEHLLNEMFYSFAVPEELHGTQGRNFEVSVFVRSAGGRGITETRTTPLHPQSDGLCGRLSLNSGGIGIRSGIGICICPWSYQTAVQESTKCTPAALMFERQLHTPVYLVSGVWSWSVEAHYHNYKPDMESSGWGWWQEQRKAWTEASRSIWMMPTCTTG